MTTLLAFSVVALARWDAARRRSLGRINTALPFHDYYFLSFISIKAPTVGHSTKSDYLDRPYLSHTPESREHPPERFSHAPQS